FGSFLRKLYDNAEECPRSYDKLHFDPRKQKCKLLARHDDYSLMSKLSMQIHPSSQFLYSLFITLCL
ncbi:unnamed protein product, partial [Brassica oleracea var. botrytis]